MHPILLFASILLCFCLSCSKTNSTSSFADFDFCQGVDVNEEISLEEHDGVLWTCWDSDQKDGTQIVAQMKGSDMQDIGFNCSISSNPINDVDEFVQFVFCWNSTKISDQDKTAAVVDGLLWRFYSQYYDYCFWSDTTETNGTSFVLNCWLQENRDQIVHFEHADKLVNRIA